MAAAAEERAAFLLGLRAAGIRDLAVLRAMELVPRAAFVSPHLAALAYRNIALPIACGQSVPPPLTVARLLAGSRLHEAMRVLVIGLGSGYTATVLSHLVAEVTAVDRFKTLVARAAERSAHHARDALTCLWADGFDLPAQAPFDRILLVGTLASVPSRLWTLVAPNGAVLYGRAAIEPQRSEPILVMAERPEDGISRQTIIGSGRLAPLREGRSAVL